MRYRLKNITLRWLKAFEREVHFKFGPSFWHSSIQQRKVAESMLVRALRMISYISTYRGELAVNESGLRPFIDEKLEVELVFANDYDEQIIYRFSLYPRFPYVDGEWVLTAWDKNVMSRKREAVLLYRGDLGEEELTMVEGYFSAAVLAHLQEYRQSVLGYLSNALESKVVSYHELVKSRWNEPGNIISSATVGHSQGSVTGIANDFFTLADSGLKDYSVWYDHDAQLFLFKRGDNTIPYWGVPEVLWAALNLSILVEDIKSEPSYAVYVQSHQLFGDAAKYFVDKSEGRVLFID